MRFREKLSLLLLSGHEQDACSSLDRVSGVAKAYGNLSEITEVWAEYVQTVSWRLLIGCE